MLLILSGVGAYFISKSVQVKLPIIPSAQAVANYGDTTESLCSRFTKKTIKCSVKWSINEIKNNGQLISQNPLKGIRGSAVSLDYSRGPAQVNVPILAGLTKIDAEKILWSAGLKLGLTKTENEAAPKDTVISSSIKPSTEVSNGTAIDLIYSSGKIKVPNWIDKPKELVEAEASELGVQILFTEKNSNKTLGTVINQTAAGSLIDFNESISVVLAKQNLTKTVLLPNVVGMNKSEAISLLASKGFLKITAVTKLDPTATSEKVVAMKPAPGVIINSATEIVLTFTKKA